MKRNITFEPEAFQEAFDWGLTDRAIFKKLGKLLIAIQRTPFEGIGKPELLKGNLKGYWSRRITDEHRIVYKVTQTEIIIISCKGNYE